MSLKKESTKMKQLISTLQINNNIVTFINEGNLVLGSFWGLEYPNFWKLVTIEGDLVTITFPSSITYIWHTEYNITLRTENIYFTIRRNITLEGIEWIPGAQVK
jgi:hypothetical protein